MTDVEQLKQIKIAMFGSDQGTWRDGMLMVYLNEVKAFMKDAGVSEDVLRSEASVGCITIGVNDLWNYQSGNAKFSPYFKERVIQLAAGKSGGDAS